MKLKWKFLEVLLLLVASFSCWYGKSSSLMLSCQDSPCSTVIPRSAWRDQHRKIPKRFADSDTMFCLKPQQINKTPCSLSPHAIKCANFSYASIQTAGWSAGAGCLNKLESHKTTTSHHNFSGERFNEIVLNSHHLINKQNIKLREESSSLPSRCSQRR